MEKIARQLGIEIAVPEVSGGPAGSRIPYENAESGQQLFLPFLLCLMTIRQKWSKRTTWS